MTRDECQAHGQKIGAFIRAAIAENRRVTGRRIAHAMNRAGLLTRWGREWTVRGFFRWMQRRELRLIDIQEATPRGNCLHLRGEAAKVQKATL